MDLIEVSLRLCPESLPKTTDHVAVIQGEGFIPFGINSVPAFVYHLDPLGLRVRSEIGQVSWQGYHLSLPKFSTLLKDVNVGHSTLSIINTKQTWRVSSCTSYALKCFECFV
jgi:hypothetical protein